MSEDMGGRLAWIKSHIREELFGQGQPIKINRQLTPEQRWVWYGLRLMAGDSPVPGVICIAEGIPYEEYQIAKQLDVKEELLKQTVDKLMQMGVISVNGNNSLEIIDFDHYHGRTNRTEYQARYMREVYRPRQKARKEEERRKKERKPNSKQANNKPKKLATKTLGSRMLARPEETRPEEEEKRRDQSNPPSPPDAEFAELIKLFENTTGQPINYNNAEAIKERLEDYMAQWIMDAIKEGVNSTGKWPGWKYTDKILERWQRDGRNSKKRKAEDEDDEKDPADYLKGKYRHLISH